MVLAAAAHAQNPVPDPDTLADPVQQGDPAVRTLPPGLDYVEDRRQINAGELPEKIKQTLNSDSRFEHWRDAQLYHDENKDEYVVVLAEQGRTTTYRFNRDGKLIIERE